MEKKAKEAGRSWRGHGVPVGQGEWPVPAEGVPPVLTHPGAQSRLEICAYCTAGPTARQGYFMYLVVVTRYAEEKSRGGFLKLYAWLLCIYVGRDVAEEIYLKNHKGMVTKVRDGFSLLWGCSPPLNAISSFGSLAPNPNN